MLRRIPLVLAAAFFATTATAQLNGTYTIDPNGTGSRNYLTFGAAVSALGAGVTGPVTFQVASAKFAESVSLTSINGASSTNQVTFIGTTGATAITGTAGLVFAAGTQWVTFDGVDVTGSTKYGLHLMGSGTGADNNTFRNMTVDVPASSSSTIEAARIEYAKNCTFQNVIFRGGGYCFYSQQINLCVLDGCEFDGKNTATYVLAPFNSNDADNLWQNCFIHSCRSTGYGAYMNLSSYGNMMWHNTIIVNSTGAAAHMGSCCAWSRACSWRNNIIVNLGTGAAVRYGETSTNKLERFDADYNCYYAPNATNGETIVTERGTFKGSLAAWKQYFTANQATLVQAGGGTIYDPNSIELNPGLVSMTSPFDIHLQAGSPCIDAGTTMLIAGSWISFPQSTVSTDFEGESRSSPVDIGADEIGVFIVGSGPMSPGTTHTLNLVTSSGDAGLPFQTASSLGLGPILVGGGRKLELTPDVMMTTSISGNLTQVFNNYNGVINATGRGGSRLIIPPLQALKGVVIHSAFVVIAPGFPFNLKRVSKTYSFQIN